MKKYLLRNTKYYKANLHLHSTLSDGLKTPEEVKEFYKKRGYSIIAFTDHDKYLNHNDLTDDEFVVLNGFELEYYITPWRQKCCHICYIAKDKNNSALGYSDIDYNPFIKELPDGVKKLNEGGSLYTSLVAQRPYDYNYINADIKKAKELGFYVTYNHPTWSLESYKDYSMYKGMDAMEIVNYGCIIEGYSEDDGRVYDVLLNLDNKINIIATDDNHNELDDNGVYTDSFGGYIMLDLDNLNYESVIDSLIKGKFYSCGKVGIIGECPYIKELSIEDNILHIECSEVKSIQLIKDIRPFKRIIMEDKPLICADFKLGEYKWFRLVIEDINGNKAYTNAYFRKDVDNEL